MKGFMKVCGIIVLILFGAGIVFTVAGFALGGLDEIERAVEIATDGKVSVNLDREFGDFEITVGDYSTNDVGRALGYLADEKIYDIEDYTGDSRPWMDELDAEKRMIDEDDYEYLSVEAAGSNFHMEYSDDDSFYIAASPNVETLEYGYGDGKIDIKISRYDEGFSTFEDDNSLVVFYVPEGYSFKKVKIDVGASNFSAKEIVAEEFEIKVGAGNADIYRCSCDEMTADIGAGMIGIERMIVGELDCKVGLGSAELNGILEDDVKLKCSMGSISLKLQNDETDFNYKFEGAMGNIEIGDAGYSGVTKEEKIDNGAEHDMKIDCAMGSVSVAFE